MAQRAARVLTSSMERDVVVLIAGGRYSLAAPLTVTAADSGRRGHDVIYRAQLNERVVLTRSTRLRRWRPSSDGTYVAKLSGDDVYRTLFVNGRRAQRARSTPGQVRSIKRRGGFSIDTSSVVHWHAVGDIEIVGHAKWRDYHCGVERIQGSDVVIESACWQLANRQPAPIQHIRYIENVKALLDEPGEWYHDRSADTVHYLPRVGENMHVAAAYVPIDGAIVQAFNASNVRLEGLTFELAGWNGANDDEGYAPIQTGQLQTVAGSIEGVGGAVEIRNSEAIELNGNVFQKLGGAGLIVNDGSQDVSVTDNMFRDISSYAIGVGEATDSDAAAPDSLHENIRIENNVIAFAGREYADSPGIFVGYGRNIRVAGNSLHNLPYSGITVGWGWGKPSYARNNEIAYNRIDHYALVLEDAGGVYTLGPQDGTTVHHNHISDNVGKYGCLYPDQGSAGMRWHHNVCERLNDRTTYSGRWLHVWTPSVRNIEVHDNYTDTVLMHNHGTNVVVRDTTLYRPGNPPYEAQMIVDAAGARS